MAEIKPFDFKKLPKVSRKAQQILDALQSFLPRIGFTDELGRAVKRLVTKELGISFSFQREKIQTVPLAATLPTLSRQGVYLVFGMAPVEGKGILELDPFLAQMAIDKLLGGKGEPLNAIRPLTEIEEGVLSYLFLKILSHIFERCGRSARVHFRLDRFCSSSDDMEALLLPTTRAAGEAVLISFRLTFGDRSGYARLILPSPFVQKVFLEPVEGAMAVEETRDFQYYAARLENLGYLETTLWAEVGRSTLKIKEVEGLEPGDVVLLEKTQARVKNGRLEGYLPIRLGKGETGAFRGEIVGKGFKIHGMELEHPIGKGV